jgi:hypothetical protein
MRHTSVLALAALAAPFGADAAELGNTYLEAGVSRVHSESAWWYGDDMRFDGGYLRGSIELVGRAYAFGRVSRDEDDWYGIDVDHHQTDIGLGLRTPISDTVDVVAEAGLRREEIGGFDLEGWRASAGVRGMLGSRVEGWAKATYTQDTLDRRPYAAQVGALYKFNPT